MTQIKGTINYLNLKAGHTEKKFGCIIRLKTKWKGFVYWKRKENEILLLGAFNEAIERFETIREW